MPQALDDLGIREPGGTPATASAGGLSSPSMTTTDPSRRRRGPRAEDVTSIDAIVTALYDTISGPAGPRDWERDRHLYAPEAILRAMRMEDGRIHAETLDFDGFVAARQPFFDRYDFFEREIGRRIDRFGNMAQVWSAYEGVGAPAGEPHQVMFRGINSMQLQWDGSRWWITAVIWDREREDNRIPPELLETPGEGRLRACERSQAARSGSQGRRASSARKASTTRGSNCRPAWVSSSAVARSGSRALR